MRLAVLAAADPTDIRTWSGTPYFMTRALQKRFPRMFIVRTPRPIWLQYLRRAAKKASRGRVDLFWNQQLAAWNAKHIAGILRTEQVDVALCIGNAPLSAFLAGQIPTIHVSDATVPLMLDYYTEFSRLPKLLAQSAWQLDQASVMRSRACLFSTEWAARSAIQDYGADPHRVHAISWGANTEPRNVNQNVHDVPRDMCHLVFIGVDWDRKGGDIAVAAATQLSAAGHAVRLHIIGAKPSLRQGTDALVIHGFINKGTEHGRLEFDRIMRQAAFLFVPTRQDCSPMVFPEANAYGVPVITTHTGGVPDVVHEGVNGHLLPLTAPAEAYADLIWRVWSDWAAYSRLRETSRRRADRVLNWDSWVSEAAPVIERVASERPDVHGSMQTCEFVPATVGSRLTRRV